jgi:hypothetical protein
MTKSKETKRGIRNIFSRLIQKNKFENFQQKMREIFKIFLNIFDQKSQNHIIMSSKYHMIFQKAYIKYVVTYVDL